MSKLYIGSELADFNEAFNVVFAIGDIRDLSAGSNNKTYTLSLPLTKTNKRLLKFISQPDVKSEPSAIGRLYIGEQLIIQGSILITKPSSNGNTTANIIISQDDWIDALKDKKMTDLDLSAYDHALTHTNVENSWSGTYASYRYPMIDFGALISGEQGVNAKWFPNDFIPMIRIVDLIYKILSPYTIVSNWIANITINNLYILAKETIASNSFITGREFNIHVSYATDNEVSDTIGVGVTKSITLADANMILNSGIDEGNNYDYGYDWYVIPETGTYNFTFAAHPITTADGAITINSQQHKMAIKRTRGASTVTLAAGIANFVSIDIFGITYTINTGYVHLEAGDKVFATRYMTQNLTNIEPGITTITMNYSIVTALSLIWNNVSEYPGIGKDISVAGLMPDMTQVDFLSAIRDIFNLRFWFDKSKQNLYIDPWDQLLSSTVIDLTEFIDFDSPETELISPNYNKTITLKWKDDTSDVAYTEYLKNAAGPGQKDITLTSLFAKPGTEIKEHSFSSLITGLNQTIGQYTTPVPRIWNTIPEYPYLIYDRKVGFNTRIVEWKGLAAGFTWYYEGDTKTQYPKISSLDWSTIYSSYWQKLFHYIDKGKLFTVRMKVKPMFLTQFFTVINSATSEGFRPTYRINDDYYFLQQITTDGSIAECELIIK